MWTSKPSGCPPCLYSLLFCSVSISWLKQGLWPVVADRRAFAAERAAVVSNANRAKSDELVIDYSSTSPTLICVWHWQVKGETAARCGGEEEIVCSWYLEIKRLKFVLLIHLLIHHRRSVFDGCLIYSSQTSLFLFIFPHSYLFPILIFFLICFYFPLFHSTFSFSFNVIVFFHSSPNFLSWRFSFTIFFTFFIRSFSLHFFAGDSFYNAHRSGHSISNALP